MGTFSKVIEERDRLRAALGPRPGSTTTVADELETVAGIIGRYDSASGLIRYLHERAALIRAALTRPLSTGEKS